MSFLNKLRLGMTNGTSRGGSIPVHSSSRSRTPGGPVSAVGATHAPESPESTRVSNGLKEFLWNLDGLGRGTLLDLGPATRPVQGHRHSTGILSIRLRQIGRAHVRTPAT